MSRKLKALNHRMTVAGATVLLILVVTGCSWTNALIFHPPQCSYQPSDVHLIRCKDSRVAMKYLPNPDATYVLLYSHGNAEDLGHTLPLMRAFRDRGFAVVTYDYPGYGLSRDEKGEPTEKGAYRSALSVYGCVTGTLKFPPERVIIVGRSVGAGPATFLAQNVESAGLVLISPFVSAFRVVTKYPILPFDKFKNLKRIAKVDEPLLVIHGTDDGVIPCWHGKKIYAAASNPKRALWLHGVGHNNLFSLKGKEVLVAVADFVEDISKGTIYSQEGQP